MISVVIPALNEEKYLPDCLKSLKNQDYTGPYEIIIADNGSTDNTVRVGQDHGARVVPCPEKKSVFYARQIGADAAQGDIIAQADADTIYPHNWLSRIAERFEKHPEVVAVTGRYIYTEPPWWSIVEYVIRTGVNWLTVPILGYPWVISGATFAFRRAVFVKLGGYHDITYAPDQWGIASRLRKAGKVAFDNKLYVITSPRSVKKPLLRIFKEGLINWGRWGRYLIKKPFSSIGKFITRIFRKNRIVSIIILLVLATAITILGFGYVLPSSSIFGKVYSSGNTSEKVIALTFDDGPNEPYTSEILDILTRYNIKATFFIIGKNAEFYPDVVHRMLSEGNVIGNHSYSHDANHAVTTFGVRDLLAGENAIFTVAGVKPHLYRPPHGKKSPWELNGVKNAGMIEVTWGISVNDEHIMGLFGKPSPDNFAKEMVKLSSPGGIILLHDCHGIVNSASGYDVTVTVKALPLIIERLQAQGYKFVTVPELLDVPAYNN
jgi:peptidoglycan-N-acetylglucosamine deacetylase